MVSLSALVRRVRAPSSLLGVCLSLVLASANLSAGCSTTETAGTGGQGGASDGKFHPKGNAVAVDELTACDTLHTALETKRTQLGCILTLPLCPDLVQVVSKKPCFQYDQGTIKGCVDYFAQAKDCPELTKRSGDCVFQVIAGSAPQGCPAQ